MTLLVLTVAALVTQPSATDPGQGSSSAIEDALALDDERALCPERHPDAGTIEHDRVRPDYDGRPGEWNPNLLIWAPRVLLFPAWVVAQYGLRTPIGAATRFIDRNNVVTRVTDALTFRNHTIGFLPIFSIANGQRPGFGVYAYFDRLFVDWHNMALTVTTDFSHNIMTSYLNQFALPGGTLNFRFAYQQRNDLVFYGVGPGTLKTDQTRFQRNKPLADLELVYGSAAGARGEASSGSVSGSLLQTEAGNAGSVSTSPKALHHLGARVGVELSENLFKCSARQPDICGSDHLQGTADDRFTLGSNGDAAWFHNGYTLFRIKALVSVDSRASKRPESSGVRFDAFGRYGEGLTDRNSIRFFRYGGELSGFVDLSGHRRRVLAARLYIEMLENVGSSAKVPFEELIALGGLETMRGFLRARFFGQSAAVASLEYRWPIWSFLDANVFYDLGNAFDHHFRDFAIDKLRGGYGFAFRTNGSRDVAFELQIAAGTKQWSITPDELRLMVGTNVGF